MKTLLFGAGGLLGRHVQHEWALQGRDLTALSHAEADITDAAHMDEVFGRPWDVVINAAAVCDFDACENDPGGTGRVNLEAPLALARRCAAQGSLFVQFSSDYVFDGKKDRLWSEEDEPRPLSAYGEQKAALEAEVPKLCPRSLVLRISWLYGSGGRTFMSLLPELLATRDELRVASGKRGRCLWAGDAAAWVALLAGAGCTGLCNLVNDGDTSWEEFAAACRDLMVADGREVRCGRIEEVPFAGLGVHGGKRPKYSCLGLERISREFPPGPRSWREALAAWLHGEKSFAAPRSL